MHRDNRCVYMVHAYFNACCSDCVGDCLAPIVEDSGFVSVGVLKYVVCLCRGCDGCCVFCLYCEAWNCRRSYMGSVSVSSFRCFAFVSCVRAVATVYTAFCMTCSLLMLIEDGRGDLRKEPARWRSLL